VSPREARCRWCSLPLRHRAPEISSQALPLSAARFLRRADHILVTSPATLERSAFLKPHRARCEVLPLAIRAADLAETERSRGVAERLCREHPDPEFSSSPHAPVQGPARPDRRHARIEGTLVLVGAGDGGEIRGRIRREGWRIGWCSPGRAAGDLPGYYRAADLFVLPSIDRARPSGSR